MHELIPIKISFGGFNGGYGKMLVYNLRSDVNLAEGLTHTSLSECEPKNYPRYVTGFF